MALEKIKDLDSNPGYLTEKWLFLVKHLLNMILTYSLAQASPP